MYEQSRKFPRVASKNVMRIGTFDGVDEAVSVSMNVCGGGCRFAIDETYNVGKVLKVFMLLSTQTIAPVSTVVWENRNDKGQYDIGVEFNTLSLADQDILEEYLSRELSMTCST